MLEIDLIHRLEIVVGALVAALLGTVGAIVAAQKQCVRPQHAFAFECGTGVDVARPSIGALVVEEIVHFVFLAAISFRTATNSARVAHGR